jgi:Tfp pilus assembly protein PilV
MKERVVKKTVERQRGFTLIEAAIAMLIMMVVGLAVSALFVYAVNYNSGANDRAMALALAQQRIEALRSRPFNHADLAATAGTQEVAEVPIDANTSRSYTVVKTIVNDSTTMKTITISVAPLGANAAWASTAVSLMTRRTSYETGQYMQ